MEIGGAQQTKCHISQILIKVLQALNLQQIY